MKWRYVYNARPHPGPLPRGEGDTFGRSYWFYSRRLNPAIGQPILTCGWMQVGSDRVRTYASSPNQNVADDEAIGFEQMALRNRIREYPKLNQVTNHRIFRTAPKFHPLLGERDGVRASVTHYSFPAGRFVRPLLRILIWQTIQTFMVHRE